MTKATSDAPLMDEDAWYALLQQARRFRDAGHDKAFIDLAHTAIRYRPHRAEPLHDLARHYLATSRGDLAILYADAGLALPIPELDHLGLDPQIYRTGLKEAFVIAASYSKVESDRDRGRTICNWLALSRQVPDFVRNLARLNYHHWYVETAASLMPSIRFLPLAVDAPDGFKPANTSIVRHEGGFIALIRAVNYDLLESGYFDRHGDSSFRQRILLARMDATLRVTSIAEVHPPSDMPPPLHTDSLGFEDPRPIVWRGALWCLSCVRQLNADGRAEMVLARIAETESRNALVEWRVLNSSAPIRWEKNWMPRIDRDHLSLIYSVDPTRLLDDTGRVLLDQTPPIATENFAGGTQAIFFDGGWLALVHEWQVLQTRRHYFHRFIWLDHTSRLQRLSRRFYFRRVASEFAAGLTWDISGDSLVISFGTDDRDPALAVVTADDVRQTLLSIEQHETNSVDACIAGLGHAELLAMVDPRRDQDGVPSVRD